MPISHQKKFIFIHIPKCAGSSVEKFLMKNTELCLMKSGVMDTDEIVKNKFYITGEVHGLERHLSALEIKSLIGSSTYDRYYKFTIVRNPYSRIVSFYEYVKGLKNPDTNKLQVNLVLNSKNFYEFVINSLNEKKMTLFFNQYQYVCDKNKKLIIDDYIKFEDLDTQWRPLSKKLLNESKLDQIRTLINPKRLDLKKINSSHKKTRNYREYYDHELRDLVTDAVITDLELFKYNF